MKTMDVPDSGRPTVRLTLMRRRQSAALHFDHWRGALRRARRSTESRRFALLILVAALTAPLSADQTSPSAATGVGGLGPAMTNWVAPSPAAPVTNAPPPVVVPVTTNATVRPNVATNAVPAPTGVAVHGLFNDIGQGKFSVAGRVLKLPAPEAAPTNEPAGQWHRAIDFGMNLSKGNTDTLRYSLTMSGVRERDEDLTSIRAHGVYGESEGIKDTQNASARARYERQISKRTYGLGYADWLTDPIAGTDVRATAIASPGWHLIRTERSILNVEAGAGFLDEKKSDDRSGFAAGRLAMSVERLLNTHVLAWGMAEYIPKFANRNVFFVNSEAGVASMLARNLTLNVILADRYDNAPATGSKVNDLNLTVSICLNF